MKKKIQSRLTSHSFLMVIGIILICTLFAMFSLRRMAVENQKEMNILLASKIHDRINNDLTEPIMVAQTMANNAFIYSFLSDDEKEKTEDECIETMNIYLSNLKEGLMYDSVFLVSAKTNRYYTDHGLNKIVDPVNDPHDIWYSLFLEKNKEYDLDVDSDEVNNNVWTVFVNARIEQDGELLGVCGVGVKMTHLQAMFTEYEEEYGVKINMIDSSGLVQVDTNEINIENAYLSEIPISQQDSEEYIYTKNKSAFSVSKYVDNLGWYLVVQSDNANLSDDYWVILMFNGGLFLFMVLAYFVDKLLHRKTIERYKESERENISIINALGNLYYSLYYVDIENQSVQELTIHDDVYQKLLDKKTVPEMRKYIVENLVSEGDRAKVDEFLELQTLDQRLVGRNSVVTEFVTNDGEWTRCGILPVEKTDDGKCRTILCTMMWITQEKLEMNKQEIALREAFEAAEAANKAKSNFLFGMSHDIRTPMNAIIGFRELLEKNQEDPEKRQDYLNKIKDASSILLSIINNVLEMARIESGSIELEERVYSYEQFSDSINSLFAELMKQKDITFTHSANIEHKYISCDTIKTREIFSNILGNAYKYTNAGGRVTMHVEELPHEKEGWAWYKTTISDTGIGMSEEFLPHLFESFSRENTSTDTKIEGTGLGMPIVKKLVEMVGGSISVESTKNVGTTFTIMLPQRIANESELISFKEKAIDKSVFAGKRILLAEDNELNAEIAIEILNAKGFEVDRAEDGSCCVEMLTKAESHYYDLILMDIQMPNMNGYEASKAIRKLPDFDKANIPIIAMTANAFDEDKKNAIEAGMNGHLAKPIDISQLMSVLAQVLNTGK